MTSKPSVPPCSVMMRSAHMPALVSRSSSASLTPGFTTATPFAPCRALIASRVTVLSSRVRVRLHDDDALEARASSAARGTSAP